MTVNAALEFTADRKKLPAVSHDRELVIRNVIISDGSDWTNCVTAH